MHILSRSLLIHVCFQYSVFYRIDQIIYIFRMHWPMVNRNRNISHSNDNSTRWEIWLEKLLILTLGGAFTTSKHVFPFITLGNSILRYQLYFLLTIREKLEYIHCGLCRLVRNKKKTRQKNLTSREEDLFFSVVNSQLLICKRQIGIRTICVCLPRLPVTNDLTTCHWWLSAIF